ncbi:MAG: hypothetical protein QOH40_2021 [Arthrobacter pascens]|nr:hypothetical protein [Arthrobacter pascens]
MPEDLVQSPRGDPSSLVLLVASGPNDRASGARFSGQALRPVSNVTNSLYGPQTGTGLANPAPRGPAAPSNHLMTCTNIRPTAHRNPVRYVINLAISGQQEAAVAFCDGGFRFSCVPLCQSGAP